MKLFKSKFNAMILQVSCWYCALYKCIYLFTYWKSMQ